MYQSVGCGRLLQLYLKLESGYSIMLITYCHLRTKNDSAATKKEKVHGLMHLLLCPGSGFHRDETFTFLHLPIRSVADAKKCTKIQLVAMILHSDYGEIPGQGPSKSHSQKFESFDVVKWGKEIEKQTYFAQLFWRSPAGETERRVPKIFGSTGFFPRRGVPPSQTLLSDLPEEHCDDDHFFPTAFDFRPLLASDWDSSFLCSVPSFLPSHSGTTLRKDGQNMFSHFLTL